MKVCSGCKVEKDFSEFNKHRNHKYGLSSKCKDCTREYNKKYQQNNKEKIAKQKKEWNRKNLDRIAEKSREYKQNNKEKIEEYQKKYRENNRDKIAERQRKYRENNKEKIAKQKKEYNQKNRDRIAERMKDYYQRNKETHNQKAKKYRQENKEKVKKQKAEYYENNRDKIEEYQKKYRENNKEKLAEYRRKYYENNRDKAIEYNQRNKEKRAKYSKEWYRKNPYQTQAGSLASEAKKRSKKKNLPIDLDFISPSNIMDLLKHQSNCVCCDRMFRIGYKGGKSGFHDDSPSLDRFYPKLGYVPGNVFLICGRCNILKRDATVKELETVVTWMKKQKTL